MEADRRSARPFARLDVNVSPRGLSVACRPCSGTVGGNEVLTGFGLLPGEFDILATSSVLDSLIDYLVHWKWFLKPRSIVIFGAITNELRRLVGKRCGHPDSRCMSC